MTKRELIKHEKVEERISSGEITDQKSYRFIMELNSYSAERLDRVAMTDGSRNYTYRQMFRNWEYYAEVFSALGMTGENGARVGILPGICAEAILAYYALNMTGASVSMIPVFTSMGNPEKIRRMVEEEGITDLIVTDVVFFHLPYDVCAASRLERIFNALKDSGLRNRIVIPSAVKRVTESPLQKIRKQVMLDRIREIPGIKMMDDLLMEYEAAKIIYADNVSEEGSLILHTSGTTKGINKPVPLSDRAVNAGVHRFLIFPDAQKFKENASICLSLEPCSAYNFIDAFHLLFAFGGKVIVLPNGIFNPEFSKALSEYQVSVMFGNPLLIKILEKAAASGGGVDLSSLKLFAMGGSYISAENRKFYNNFIKDCGGHIKIMNGYGLTEIGGAGILSPEDREDDSIGYPLPGVKVKICDEEKGVFHSPEEGPVTGGLYIYSDSMSTGCIDDRKYFEFEEIDGIQYLCTNDLVKVGEDGILTSLGRVNRFFVNNEGMRFEAGLVENAMTSRPGINTCVAVPEYSRTFHDSVPVLYINGDDTGSRLLSKVRDALLHCFREDENISSMTLPEAVVIAEDIPFASSGKVDVYRITKGEIDGVRYTIKPVFRKELLKDIRFEEAEKRVALDVSRAAAVN